MEIGNHVMFMSMMSYIPLRMNQYGTVQENLPVNLAATRLGWRFYGELSSV